ncbi:cytochrome P450 [Pyrrhoderma noxium]|uniref:Cytochrome P450 n=1 Tax=Pyrrhoderma noxium TaxID=2282107 RepID=A0A286U701_9AGAM|nr:cytochrome P450 [Pyrrhoderma noxium]
MQDYHLMVILAVLCATVAAYLSRSWIFRKKQVLPYPPGPRALPILGNVLDMRDARHCETLRRWKDDYGPIVHLKKRGNIYSSRPRLVMNELEGWDDCIITILPYGPELRRSREKLHQFLQPSVVQDYYPFQEQSAYGLAESLLKDPENFLDVVKCSTAGLITNVTYGYKVTSFSDPIVRLAEKGVEAFADAQGFYLVNELPWLQYLPSWLPGMGFLRTAKEASKTRVDMYQRPYEKFKENLESGIGSSSFSARILESFREKDGVVTHADEEFTAKLTSVVYAAGTDTTVSALSTFILAMILNPEVQRKAQEEVDNVLGKNSLPTFADLPKLKYVDAVKKECMRWQSVVQTSVPHVVTRDDEINGYFIPANSVIMGNFWAILRDPVEYPEPDQFKPERFIPSEGTNLPLDPGKVVFSVGRRFCPGKYFAENSLFIDMATIFATCNIGNTIDDHGNPIIPKVEYTELFVRHPLPFKCSITPRNYDSLQLLRRATDIGLPLGD